MTKSQKKGPAFLLKTFQMLQRQQFKQIIDWIKNGSGFVVKNPHQLSQKVLPKYFKHSNMHSFIRQLNMYGFNKKRGSKIQNYYFHRQFRKGQKQLIFEMQRKVQRKGPLKQIKKQQHNQQISIQIEQSQQEKQNMNQQNMKINTQIQEMVIRSKIVQLTAANKLLIIEQIHHLANTDSNNLLYFNLDKNPETIQSSEYVEYKQILDKFKKIKDQYLKMHSLMWDRINSKVQKFQEQTYNKSISYFKQTRIQISKENLQKKQKIAYIYDQASQQNDKIQQQDLSDRNQSISCKNQSISYRNQFILHRNQSISNQMKQMDSQI